MSWSRRTARYFWDYPRNKLISTLKLCVPPSNTASWARFDCPLMSGTCRAGIWVLNSSPPSLCRGSWHTCSVPLQCLSVRIGEKRETIHAGCCERSLLFVSWCPFFCLVTSFFFCLILLRPSFAPFRPVFVVRSASPLIKGDVEIESAGKSEIVHLFSRAHPSLPWRWRRFLRRCVDCVNKLESVANWPITRAVVQTSAVETVFCSLFQADTFLKAVPDFAWQMGLDLVHVMCNRTNPRTALNHGFSPSSVQSTQILFKPFRKTLTPCRMWICESKVSLRFSWESVDLQLNHDVSLGLQSIPCQTRQCYKERWCRLLLFISNFIFMECRKALFCDST